MTNPAKHWYRPTAVNYTCPDSAHPTPSRELVKSLAAHIGMSNSNTRHLIDRLRHLSTCCDEREAITLMRLMPGDKQVPQPRISLASERVADSPNDLVADDRLGTYRRRDGDPA